MILSLPVPPPLRNRPRKSTILPKQFLKLNGFLYQKRIYLIEEISLILKEELFQFERKCIYILQVFILKNLKFNKYRLNFVYFTGNFIFFFFGRIFYCGKNFACLAITDQAPINGNGIK